MSQHQRRPHSGSYERHDQERGDERRPGRGGDPHRGYDTRGHHYDDHRGIPRTTDEDRWNLSGPERERYAGSPYQQRGRGARDDWSRGERDDSWRGPRDDRDRGVWTRQVASRDPGPRDRSWDERARFDGRERGDARYEHAPRYEREPDRGSVRDYERGYASTGRAYPDRDEWGRDYDRGFASGDPDRHGGSARERDDYERFMTGDGRAYSFRGSSWSERDERARDERGVREGHGWDRADAAREHRGPQGARGWSDEDEREENDRFRRRNPPWN